jgi:integrase
MPRQVRDASLDSRTARSRLKVAHKPYYRLIERGLHLGYRKLASGPGNWLVRHYQGDGDYRLKNIGTADDYDDADGRTILNFGQAQDKAREEATAKRGPYTVAQALEEYFQALDGQGRSARLVNDARTKANALIVPAIGAIPVSDLTALQLRRWRDTLAASPPRVRTTQGAPQRHREVTGEDAKRARRATVNRIWAILRAALNQAFRDNLVPSDAEWRKVKPFKKTDRARLRYLKVVEAKRLIKACPPEFRALVQAALQTGARYSELTRLTTEDFDPATGTIHIRQSKSGDPRHVVLTDEGIALFHQLTAGRPGNAPILHKADGSAWGYADQRKPMLDAVKQAKIEPPISFHGLRHTWASLAVMNGVPLLVVARNLGHTSTRMVETHYGHLAKDYITDAIKAGAPRFD